MRKFRNVATIILALVLTMSTMTPATVQAKDTIKKRDVFGNTIIIPVLKAGDEINNYKDFVKYCEEPVSVKYTAANGKVYRNQQMELILGYNPHDSRLTVTVERGRDYYKREMDVKSIDYVSLEAEQAQYYKTNLKIDASTGTATFRGAVFQNGAYWKCILKYKDISRLK